MPQCAFKNCKNNYRKSNLSDGVSYFRFPNNLTACAKWTAIVAKERNDESYRPAKTSVICSTHFDESEMSGNSQRRRLIKTAIPTLRIQASTKDAPPAKLETNNALAAPEVQQPLQLSLSSGLDHIKEATCNQDQRNPTSKKRSTSFNALISVWEEKEKKRRKQLIVARKKIQTLQKANKRLVKKNSLLKNMIKGLVERMKK